MTTEAVTDQVTSITEDDAVPEHDPVCVEAYLRIEDERGRLEQASAELSRKAYGIATAEVLPGHTDIRHESLEMLLDAVHRAGRILAAATGRFTLPRPNEED